MQFGACFGQFSAVRLRTDIPLTGNTVYTSQYCPGCQNQKHLLQCTTHCPESLRFGEHGKQDF